MLSGDGGEEDGDLPDAASHEVMPVARPLTSLARHDELRMLPASLGWVRKPHSTRTAGASVRLVTERLGRLWVPRLREPVAAQAACWMEAARAAESSGGRGAPAERPAAAWSLAMSSGWRGHEK